MRMSIDPIFLYG